MKMNTLIRINQNSPPSGCCAVGGQTIFQKPEWIDIGFGHNFKVNICQISDRILYLKSIGYIRYPDLDQLISLTGDVVKNSLCRYDNYVQINDWSELEGISRAARKFYIDYIKKDKQLSGFIMYGVSPILKMSVKLAIHCNAFNTDIQIVDDYPSAVRIAREINGGIELPERNFTAALFPSASIVSETPCKIVTNPDWHLRDNKFSLHFEVRNEYVLHGITSGRMEEEHIGPSMSLQEKITRSMGMAKRPYYLVLGVMESRGTAQKNRKLYVNAILDLYHKYPFQMFIFYGANRRLMAGISLSRPFVPFRVLVVEDFRAAIKVIEEDKTSRIQLASQSDTNEVVGDASSSDQINRYVDELLIFLEKINWEETGMGINEKIEFSHPFRSVFDAIGLIKRELDDLFLERMRGQEEKVKLELKLQQARKMEEMGTIAGGVAHDLNNVLSGLVGYPELVLMNMPESAPYRKHLLSIKQSGEKAAAIVQDLLTLTRRGVMATEIINLNLIVTDYLESPEYEFLKSLHSGIRVETDLEMNLQNIKGSPVHLSKTVMNLISNAMEAMTKGGIIHISSDNMHLDKPLYLDKAIKGYDRVSEGDYVVLKIADTGIGILDEDLERIFEPFYTRKKMGRSGTGLGMSVVWGTVRDHQGYIDVQSTKGKGSVFTLFFPVTREILPCDNSPFSIKNIIGKGENILIVDDIAEHRKLASEMLTVLGYSVESVPNGEAAVGYLQNNSCDLIVLDMDMDSVIDGLETYKQIIALCPAPKAIFTGVFVDSERIAEAQKLGAGACIQKPYTLKMIGMAVKTELERGLIKMSSKK